MSDVRVFTTSKALAEGAASEVTRIVGDAVSWRGACSLVLAGGSTPQAFYKELSVEPCCSQIHWPSLSVFWGDERCVPVTDPESNYAMAWETLLSRVPIQSESVHRIRGELDPALAAKSYAADLRRVTGEAVPRFDLVLLGLGADGHTASLFPDTPDLLDEQRIVIPTVSPQSPRQRVTLTLRVLNAARAVMFLVHGQEKARVLREVLAPEREDAPSRLPAAEVKPQDGLLLWYVDRAAAAELPDRMTTSIDR